MLCSVVVSILMSCDSSHVERTQLTSKTVVDDLFTNFPGTMCVYGKYLIILNPFMKNGIINIYDRVKGEELLVFGTLGQGPQEFTSPLLGNLYTNQLVVFDLNLGKKTVIHVDSLFNLSHNPIHLTDILVSNIHRIIKIDSNLYVTTSFFDELPPFKVHNETSIISTFGKNPIPQKSNFPQGGLTEYHPSKRLFFYFSSQNPYIACYQRIEDDFFELKWENQFIKPRFSISNNTIQWDKEQYSGISEIAFSKKYIVCLRNELKLSEIQGRETSTAPRCLYLFDYEGHLKKIVDLPSPSVRVASEIDSDTVYVISVEPHYSIVEYDLSVI